MKTVVLLCTFTLSLFARDPFPVELQRAHYLQLKTELSSANSRLKLLLIDFYGEQGASDSRLILQKRIDLAQSEVALAGANVEKALSSYTALYEVHKAKVDELREQKSDLEWEMDRFPPLTREEVLDHEHRYDMAAEKLDIVLDGLDEARVHMQKSYMVAKSAVNAAKGIALSDEHRLVLQERSSLALHNYEHYRELYQKADQNYEEAKEVFVRSRNVIKNETQLVRWREETKIETYRLIHQIFDLEQVLKDQAS